MGARSIAASNNSLHKTAESGRGVAFFTRVASNEHKRNK